MQLITRYSGTGYSPTYDHDCADCIFCGRMYRAECSGLRDEEGVDVWFCPSQQELITRMGNAPQEYMSMGVDYVRRMSELGGDGDLVQALMVYDNVCLSPAESVPDLHRVKVSVHYSVDEDEFGEGGYHVIFVTHDDVPDEILDEHVRELHPATHCQHSHDCCGHAYASSPYCSLRDDRMAVYKQSWHLNI